VRAFVGTPLALIAALTLAILAVLPAAGAQPTGKVPRIGVLQPGTPTVATHLLEALEQGLRERGYVEGQNIIIESRFGEGSRERTAELAAELVRIKVAVIVTSTDAAIAAESESSRTRVASWPMGRTSPICGGAPPLMWIESSRVPSLLTCQSSRPPSSSWSSI
jgi:hypothetical protein